MTVRRATPLDLSAIQELWLASEAERPPAPWIEVDEAGELREVEEIVTGEIAVVAEGEDGAIDGFALARRRGSRLGLITDLYVAPAARRRGIATALAREAVAALHELGLDTVRLVVVADNAAARAAYARWGFREEKLVLVSPLHALAERLAPASGASLGAVFVQTDDVAAVQRAATAFAPRIGSRATTVDPPENGWTAVRDSVATGDPAALRRLAKELSDRLGAVVLVLGIEAGAVVRLVAFERGSVMDEYLSVPEFHGPLPPGDVVGLAANPTVLARLTGGDPAAIRAAAPTGASLADVPPAGELAAALAAALGVPGLRS